MSVQVDYKFLESRPRSTYRQLWVKGRHMRAEVRFRGTVGPEPETPEQIASEYSLPVEAVLEAIDYCTRNKDLLDAERAREPPTRLRRAMSGRKCRLSLRERARPFAERKATSLGDGEHSSARLGSISLRTRRANTGRMNLCLDDDSAKAHMLSLRQAGHVVAIPADASISGTSDARHLSTPRSITRCYLRAITMTSLNCTKWCGRPLGNTAES